MRGRVLALATTLSTMVGVGVGFNNWNCNNGGVDAKERYHQMRDALKKTGRPIVFSLCEWGQNKAVGVGERHWSPVAHHR